MSVSSVPSSPFRRALGESPAPLPRLNTSPTARQSPTIIPGPTSPTKSIRADFMRTSQTSTTSAAPPDPDVDVFRSSMDVADFSPSSSAHRFHEELVKEEQKKYAVRDAAADEFYEDLVEGEKEKFAARHSLQSLSFFDIDSSEASGVERDQARSSNEEEEERPAERVGREDSMSTVRAPNNTRLNSKASNLSKASKASNLTESQIERYMTNAYITPSKENISYPLADLQDTPDKGTTSHTLADFQTPMKETAAYTLADFQENTPGQALTTTDERKLRPISDLSFGNYSLKLPQNRLSGTTNTSIPASVSSDRVISTYSTMLNLMQEPSPDELAYSESVISPTGNPSPQNVQSSPLNPLAASFRLSNLNPNPPSAFRSFSSPRGPASAKRNTRHVSLRPPPLKPTSLHSNFVPPAEYTPYPTITGLGGNTRHSFPLQTRNQGWERLADRSPGEAPGIPNSIHNARLPVVLRRRHTSRTAHIVLPSAFDSNGTNTNGNTRSKAHAANPSQISFHSRLSTPASPVFDPSAPGPATAELASLHFDDEDLFLALRHAYYADLLGKSALSRFVRRYFAARTLVRVKYVPDPLAVGLGIGGEMMGMGMGMGLGLGIEELPAPEEGELMKRWYKPEGGKGSFEVVRWAWSVACAGGGGGDGYNAGGLAGQAAYTHQDHQHQQTQTQQQQQQHQHQPTPNKTATTVHVSPAPPSASDSDTLYPPNPTFPFPIPSLYPTFNPSNPSNPFNSPTPARGHVQLEEGWAIWRIVCAVGAVLMAAVGMVVVWVFVGVGGNGDAARVQEAFVMGLVVLAIGMCQVLAWLGGSWVVM